MTDWADEEKCRRDSGQRRPLLQRGHQAVNAKYPGETLERCIACGQPTGRAGKGEDSLFTANNVGPYCWDCWGRLGFSEEFGDE